MKKAISLLLVVALTAAIAVAGTLAYLTMDAGEENNLFTVGNINISLDEEVGIFGEGGEVEKTEDGAQYTDVMPGDYLKKEVTVSNNGKTDAYVAVTVTLNNADKINNAIDEVYGDGAEGGQAMYDFVFDGWGINQDPRPGAYGVSDARGVIDGTYGLPEYVLHVDFAKTTPSSTVIGATNWFIAGNEKAGQYWVDNSRGEGKVDNGYYTASMEDYEICYTYYMLLPAGEETTLFKGLNVPAEFNAEQLAMFDGLEINVSAKAIQADNMTVAAQYKNDVNGKAKTAFAILSGAIETPEFSNKPSGKMNPAYTSTDRIWGENSSNAKESHVIKLYSGDTYMGQTSLNNLDGIIDGDVTVTWSIKLDAVSNGDGYWTMKWEKAPTIDLQPTRAELWVDGEKVDENVVQLNGPDNLNKIGGVVIDANDKILRYVVKGADANAAEGETYVPFVTGDAELSAAVKAGATTIWLNDGIYKIGNETQRKTLTIMGNAGAVIAPVNEGELGMDYGFDGSTVTFEGVTIDTTSNGGTYPGFARMAATFNNCTINGTLNLTSGDKVFNNCVFNRSGDAYNVWTWGVKNVSFKGCTFNCDGKSILVYNQSCNVTISNCVFNDNGSISGKAALETGVDNGNTVYNIYIDEATVFNGFDVTGQNSVTYGGTDLGTNVWGNKNLLPADKLNVWIDGTEVY